VFVHSKKEGGLKQRGANFGKGVLKKSPDQRRFAKLSAGRMRTPSLVCRALGSRHTTIRFPTSGKFMKHPVLKRFSIHIATGYKLATLGEIIHHSNIERIQLRRCNHSAFQTRSVGRQPETPRTLGGGARGLPLQSLLLDASRRTLRANDAVARRRLSFSWRGTPSFSAGSR